MKNWKSLGYVFKDLRLLRQALTHSSFVYEQGLNSNASNQRLEFLGDAVLELITSDILYSNRPNLSEGELSKARANIVCEPSLAAYARKLGLGVHIILGYGEAAGGGANKDSILSDALEALIGAIYLDGGLEAAYKFVQSLRIDESVNWVSISDPKSSLQEEIQKWSREPLVYKIVEENGPAHQKEFVSTVSHGGRILGNGRGKSKKESERQAALVALKKLKDA